MINRRSMLTRIAGACAASLPASRLLFSQAAQPVSVPDPPTQRIPRYRGFNLQWERPAGNSSKSAFAESDLAIMREWGFNFARIPLSYWIWSKPSAWMSIDEKPFEEIDRLINLGKHYNIHINLNLHRIPGYCINERELEPADLFSGRMQEKERALKAACYHWSWIARRYRGIPSTQLSFDLINEPPRMRPYEGYLEERYFEVASALVAAIRAEDPNRMIFADGINIGQLPVPEFIPLHLVQSTRGYQPKAISHYRATWVPLDEYETMKPPTWPLTDDKGTVWDRARLAKEYLDPWRSLIAQGVQIHVGEWGCYNQTPHDIALAWMSDCLSTWSEVGWGNALWNLRGSFGILDSERKDVAYENFKGHKLDRKMLELLRSA